MYHKYVYSYAQTEVLYYIIYIILSHLFLLSCHTCRTTTNTVCAVVEQYTKINS